MLIQDEEVNIEAIYQMCDTLDESEQETMDIMIRLSEKNKGEQDSKSCCKLSQEMEQLETEYTSAQNRAQEVLDSKSVKLSKNQHTSQMYMTLRVIMSGYQSRISCSHLLLTSQQ